LKKRAELRQGYRRFLVPAGRKNIKPLTDVCWELVGWEGGGKERCVGGGGREVFTHLNGSKRKEE